jgi:hypothetical protein
VRNYYRMDTRETESGRPATLWFEFVDLQPTRKVTKIGSRWLCSLDQWDPEAGLLIADQPLHPGEFDEEGEEISAEEFERAWRRALQARAQR